MFRILRRRGQVAVQVLQKNRRSGDKRAKVLGLGFQAAFVAKNSGYRTQCDPFVVFQ
jgi:hypothetical protein